jgi:hypothetical protein
MDAAASIFPARYVISRSLRIPHFVRALLMTGAGALLLLIAEVPQLESWKTLIWVIGIVAAFSGGCALIGVVFALLFHKEQVIEVDRQGLEVSYADGKRQMLFWDDVVSYEVRSKGAVGMGDMATTAEGDGGIVGMLFGCLIALLINLYMVGLGRIVAGQKYDVRFNLSEKRILSISGFGQPMDELIQKVLPQFLADKKM